MIALVDICLVLVGSSVGCEGLEDLDGLVNLGKGLLALGERCSVVVDPVLDGMPDCALPSRSDADFGRIVAVLKEKRVMSMRCAWKLR